MGRIFTRCSSVTAIICPEKTREAIQEWRILPIINNCPFPALKKKQSKVDIQGKQFCVSMRSQRYSPVIDVIIKTHF
jgi:hypothetical protein